MIIHCNKCSQKGVSAACWEAGTETEYTSKAAWTRYQGRCSYYRQWHRLPEPSLLVLHRFLYCAGPAGSGGCQNPLKKNQIEVLENRMRTERRILCSNNVYEQYGTEIGYYKKK